MDGFGGINNHHQDTNTYYSGGWVEGSKQTQETDGTKGTTLDSDGNGNVVFTEQVIVLRKTALIPTLTAPVNLTSLERNDYYLSIYEKFGFANSNTLSHGNSVMFDVYAMMAIIQEIGQKMRNVMRMLRKVENQAVYLNIKQQAAIQREAAMVSMIVGVVMAVVQFAMMGRGLRDQLKGIGMQQKGAIASGADMARDQHAMTQVGGEKYLANKQYNTVLRQSSPEAVESTKMTNYENACKTVDIGKLKSDVKTATTELKTAQDKLTNLQNKTNPKATTKELADAQNDIKVAEGKLENANMQLDAGKMKLHNAALEDVKVYEGNFDKARQTYAKLKADPKTDPAKLEAAKADMQKAGDQYRLARATQVKTSANLELREEVYADVTYKANASLANFKEAEALNSDTIKSQKLTVHGQMILMFSQCLGTMAQSLIQGIRDIISSKATELQAEQKVIEEQFDQIKDLFSLQQSVIQKAIDTLGSIFSREAGINDQIWRA